jgi:site-specific recombinase XerD
MKLGSFNESDSVEPQENETIPEFYERYRGKEIKSRSMKSVYSSFASLNKYVKENDKSIYDFDKNDALNWCNWMLQKQGLKGSTASKYLGSVAQVIDELKTDNYIGGTDRPFKKAKETDPFDYDSSSDNWPEIKYTVFVDAVIDISHPRRLIIVVLSTKTGIRIATLSNLDERDININHPVSDAIDDPRPEIANKPNSIYVDSSINSGEKHNGEIRNRSVKLKSHREIPIDQETADFLGWFLACRPVPVSSANPILPSSDGSRFGVAGIEDEVNEFAKNNGWDGALSISHHFFRHWYVTQMRSNLSSDDLAVGTPKSVVKGLRGDSDDDTIDTYTHDWVEGVEEDYDPYDEVIRQAIPKFR